MGSGVMKQSVSEHQISFLIYLSPGSDCPSRSMPKASISSMNITAGDLAFHRYNNTFISNFLRRQEFALSNTQSQTLATAKQCAFSFSCV